MKQTRRLLSHKTYFQHFLFTALLALSNSSFATDTNNNSLADHITDTQRLAEQLQSQLKSSRTNTITPTSSTPSHQGEKIISIGMMDNRKGMGNRANNINKMGGNMGMMKCTGMSNSDGKLSAFPGNKHLYHLGANNFFLDSVDAIGLSASQQQLKQISLNWQNAAQQYN